MNNIFKKAIAFTVLLLGCVFVQAQVSKLAPPSGLMCDLVGNTEYRSQSGYVINNSFAALADKDVKMVHIASKQPAFSWAMSGQHNNARQTAYQLLLSDSPLLLAKDSGDINNSGKVFSTQSASVTIKNIVLKPNTAYCWKVRVWNELGEVSPYSSPRTFYTDSVL